MNEKDLNELNFLDEFIEQITRDYKTPKTKVEVSISSLLSIFLSDLLNHKDIIDGNLLEEHFEFYKNEFPIKQKDNHLSTNMDYLFINSNTLLIIELKTSNSSYNISQMRNYRDVKKKIINEGAGFLIDDLKSISSKSKYRLKYNETYPFLKNSNDLYEERNKFNKINKAEIIYIAPKSLPETFKKCFNDVKIISFEKLSEIKLSEDIYGKYKSDAWEKVSNLCSKIETLNEEFCKI